MKVVFQYQGLISDEYKRTLEENLPEDVQLVFMENNEEEGLLREITDAEVFVGYKLTKPLIDTAKKLRHIQIPWTGFNDLGAEFLEGRDDITVSNSHANSQAIAEHAVALLLAASKLLTQRDRGMRSGDWSTRYEDVNSVWLTDRTTAIIGYGAIGKKVARMMKHGFNNRILAIKRTPLKSDDLAEFVGGMEDLDSVLPQADFVVVAVPLTNETRRLITAKQFELMRENTVIVNIARGEVIDEEALYSALKERKIHSAGIDVWYNYPRGEQRVVKQNYPFEELDNIVMTPHSAFKVEKRERVFLSDIVTNLQRLYEGKEPINRVYLELGY